MANKKVAFICTHNACRSQIAEALAKHMGIERYEFSSAGSIPQKQIDPNAFRIMKNESGIDMSGQYSKTVQDIPKPDIAISMGCGVRCPYIGRAFDDDWGLEDPTGKTDEAYLAVIQQIRFICFSYCHNKFLLASRNLSRSAAMLAPSSRRFILPCADYLMNQKIDSLPSRKSSTLI